MIKKILRPIVRPVRDLIHQLQCIMLSCGLPRPTHGLGRFVRRDSKVKVKIRIAKGARVLLKGNVIFQSDLGEIGYTKITIEKNANLSVLGDFQIGSDVMIMVCEGAELVLGGKRLASASGVTNSAKIMVRKRVDIGCDTIIAWGTFITDCDWHTIHGKQHTVPTQIGDNVWIAHGASILKGSQIGNGSIVAAHAVCSMKEYPEAVLLAGVPAKVIQENISWTRELL